MDASFQVGSFAFEDDYQSLPTIDESKPQAFDKFAHLWDPESFSKELVSIATSTAPKLNIRSVAAVVAVLVVLCPSSLCPSHYACRWLRLTGFLVFSGSQCAAVPYTGKRGCKDVRRVRTKTGLRALEMGN
jgi:hypothetical protein